MTSWADMDDNIADGIMDGFMDGLMGGLVGGLVDNCKVDADFLNRGESSLNTWTQVTSKVPCKKRMNSEKSNKSEKSEKSEKSIKCVQCRAWFSWSAEDQVFYESKRFDEPKRCKECISYNKTYGKPARVDRKKTLSV